jgi:hypothetical protein
MKIKCAYYFGRIHMFIFFLILHYSSVHGIIIKIYSSHWDLGAVNSILGILIRLLHQVCRRKSLTEVIRRTLRFILKAV